MPARRDGVASARSPASRSNRACCIAAICAYLSSGYNSGAWTGPGIVSSSADAHHGLGFGDGADGVIAGLASNAIVVQWARYGDLNLDGTVDMSDLILLAQHYTRMGQNWDQGDMNYDGEVNFSDLLTLAQNYGGTASIAQPLASLASAAPAPDELTTHARRRRVA